MKSTYKVLMFLALGLLINGSLAIAHDGVSHFEEFKSKPSTYLSGEAFAEQLNSRNADKVIALIDAHSMSKKIETAIGQKIPGLAGQLVSGLKRGFINNMFMSMTQNNGSASFRRVITVDGQKRALVLIDFGDEGLNFLELIPHPKTSKVTDIYVHTSGEKLTDSMAKAMGMLMPDSSNLFKRMLDIKEVDKSLVDKFRQIGQLNRQGKQAEVYKIFKSFPPKLKRTRFIASLTAMYSQFYSEAAYDNELKNLDRLHGDDPELFLLLMDHYFGTEQYDRAIQGLKRLNARFEDDSMLHYLMSVTYYTAGKQKDAKSAINQAIKLEPSKEDLYWFKADILLKLKAYKELVTLIKKVEKDFEVVLEPDSLMTIEGWKEFFNSKEYKSNF